MSVVRVVLRRIDSGPLVAIAVAVGVAWLAYDNGSYSLASRATLAIAVWWGVLLVVTLGLAPLTQLPRATLVVGGLLAMFGVWTAISVLWAPSLEAAFNEINRVSLFTGIYVLVALLASRRSLGRWADALALAIPAIAVVALVSRLFPGSFSDRDLGLLLPGAITRLSFPLGYWNGLAIFVALGVPVLLRVALVARASAIRGLALAPLPVIASVIFLASSRGGVVTAATGMVAFVLLTERRWNAGAAIVVGGISTAAAIVALLARDELVNGPLGSELVERQGRSAAAVIALAGLSAAVVYGLGCHFLGGRIDPSPRAGQIAAGVTVLALVGGIAASDPVSRYETFTTPPEQLESFEPGDFVTAHLLSGSGSGRWQQWTSAIDQFASNVPLGDGAGSFEVWWAEHAPIIQSVKDGHSLYLETLGELGVVGLVLLVALVLAGLVVGAGRTLRAAGDRRVTLAALTAVYVGFAAAAGFDWVWELTAVALVGVVALALVTGPGAAVPEPLRPARPGEFPDWSRGRRLVLGFGIAAAAWLAIVGQAVPLLADREITRSAEAVDEGDLATALERAASARDIQPWAASPYLQLALVAEQRNELARARSWVEEAIERNPRSWRPWLVAARIETKLGRVRAAERSLRRAAALNPRSPLFAGLFEDDVRSS